MSTNDNPPPGDLQEHSDDSNDDHILQPFEKCAKRDLWDKLYGDQFKMDMEKEQVKIL